MTQLDTRSMAHAPAMHAPGIGSSLQRIKQWVPVQLAGEGPFARVYRARPARGAANRTADYALKTLRPPWEDDPRAISLLRREAVVGRAVSHPHLISILAAGVTAPPYYVVMPWLTGATLARMAGGARGERRREGENGRRGEGEGACGRRGDSGLTRSPLLPFSSSPLLGYLTRPASRLPLALVFWIARQVAEAMEALYAAGWMHGDVKPSNIFVGPDGHVTLLDLGFARLIDRPGTIHRMVAAVERWMTGTYHYMAPEAFSPAMTVDVRSDIYSLGVVIYEMLAGRVPFQGRDPGELARQHRGCRVPELRQVAPDVPAEAAALVHEMVAKEPLRRPQTPRELIERLVAMEIATFSDR